MPTRRNYSSIYFDGKTRLQSYTPVNNFNAQGVTKGYLDIIAIEMERLYDMGDYIYRSTDPTRSVGTDLDNIGFLVGENRDDAVYPADYTTTNFYFYIDQKLNWSANQLLNQFYNATELASLLANGWIGTNGSRYTILIPKGTVVSNSDGTISYLTLDNVVLDTGSAYVGVIATTTGSRYNVDTNVLISNALYQVPELRKIATYIKNTNSFPISNGAYQLTDDQFRYKIATKSAALQGNELAVRRAALAVPGIRDILYEKNKFGSGTAHIIVDAVSPLASEGLIAAVKQATQAITAYGDMIFVDRPVYRGIEINYNIVTAPGTTDPLSLVNQVQANIIQYINNLPIGGQIIWNQVIDIAMNIAGVVDFVPNYFKIGQYNIINKINTQQIVLRFRNQQAEYTEKFYTDTGLVCGCAT